MISGELKNKVDRVWDAFRSGGISNPLEVVEQTTYLLFMRRLDVQQKRAESRARLLEVPLTGGVYGADQQHLRWGALKDMAPSAMHRIVEGEVFPFLRSLGGAGEDSAYAVHMRDARFTIPTAALLSKAVDMVEDMEVTRERLERDAETSHHADTGGDLYEYLLSKLATAGVNGQFRTPRHVQELMVSMVNPTPRDTICDPACGTAGFLVTAAHHVRAAHPDVMRDAELRNHFHKDMFHGYDFDSTMLRIAAMNLLQHGVEDPEIRYRDSLSESAAGDAGKYSLILANPPFAGSLDYEQTSQDLQRMVRTKKTELLFLALFLKLLKPGGRAAVIVPDGVLFGSTKAHKELRKSLVEDQKLDAIVKLPSGVFKPYAGVSTAILFFTKTNSGGTDHVWFYDVTADGFSLDDKRNPTEANDLPDVLARWAERDGTERDRDRTEQSFCVSKADIVAQGYDLSINRYKEIVHEEVEHRDPLDIIADIEQLYAESAQGIAELKAMLS